MSKLEFTSRWGKSISIKPYGLGTILVKVGDSRSAIVERENVEELRDFLIEVVGPKPEPKPLTAREFVEGLEPGTLFRSTTSAIRYVRIHEGRAASLKTGETFAVAQFSNAENFYEVFTL